MENANDDQVAYWNDQAGETWAELQPAIDRQIAPLGLRGIDALAPHPGEHILDVGCGCGDTTLELARRVTPGGSVLGVDISAPMLEIAIGRAAGITAAGFRQADAQIAPFEKPFDAAFSRFGVMFFADPTAAFANIRAALRPGGRLAFVCWRQPAENPWMMVPLAAALQILPPQPPSDPLAPGPFAFADPDRTRTVLTTAGFRNIEIAARDLPIGGFALDDAVKLALRVGPLGRVLRELPDRGDEIIDAVRGALKAHDAPNGIWLGSGTWLVTAER